VNLASNHGAIYKDLYGINKVLSLLNERGDPPFLFPNLSSCNTKNQWAKFNKNLFQWNDLKNVFRDGCNIYLSYAI